MNEILTERLFNVIVILVDLFDTRIFYWHHYGSFCCVVVLQPRNQGPSVATKSQNSARFPRKFIHPKRESQRSKDIQNLARRTQYELDEISLEIVHVVPEIAARLRPWIAILQLIFTTYKV